MDAWGDEHARDAWRAAYDLVPGRAEALVKPARWYRARGDFAAAFLHAQAARGLLIPPDGLYVEQAAYRWQGTDEAAIAAWYVGEPALSFRLCQELLDGDALPECERAWRPTATSRRRRGWRRRGGTRRRSCGG